MPHFHFPPLEERRRCAGAAFGSFAVARTLAIPPEGPRWPETLLATCHLKENGK